MAQRPGQPQGTHQRHPKQYIGKVTHRGPGQAALDMGLLQRPAAAVQNGKNHQQQYHALGPGTPQQSGSKAVIGNTHGGEGACVDHRHRMKQGRHRRGRHARPGQPAREGPDGSFNPESQKAQHIHQKHHIGLVPYFVKIQHTSRHECGGGSIGQDKDHADKSKGRTAQHIVQVATAGQHRLPGPGMHDQRQRHQAHHLKEKIHGQDIVRHGNSQRYAIGDHVEHEKAFLVAIIFHVLKGI